MILEFAIATILFSATLFVCYVLLRILLNVPKKSPAPESKPSKKKVTCELNEIMGYDFIQIKYKNDSQYDIVPSENPSDGGRPESLLYATASTTEEVIQETESGGLDLEEEKVLKVSDNDIDIMMGNPWPNASDMETQMKLANIHASQNYDFDDPEDEEMLSQPYDDHEKEIDQFRDSVYEMMNFMSMDDSDREALNKISQINASHDDR